MVDQKLDGVFLAAERGHALGQHTAHLAEPSRIDFARGPKTPQPLAQPIQGVFQFLAAEAALIRSGKTSFVLK